MIRLWILAGVLAGALQSQSTITAPVAGIVRQGSGLHRQVVGVSGNFVAGEFLGDDVVSAALAGKGLLVKTADRLRVVDPDGKSRCELPAPAGPALMSISEAGETALIFYRQSGELQILRACRVSPVPLDPMDTSGNVISLLLRTPRSAELLVDRGGELWRLTVSLPRGLVTDELPLDKVRGPALQRRDGTLLFGDGKELVVRARDGAERRVPLDAPVTDIAGAGNGWVHIVTGGGEGAVESHVFLRSTGDGEEVFHLPEAAR